MHHTLPKKNTTSLSLILSQNLAVSAPEACIGVIVLAAALCPSAMILSAANAIAAERSRCSERSWASIILME